VTGLDYSRLFAKPVTHLPTIFDRTDSWRKIPWRAALNEAPKVYRALAALDWQDDFTRRDTIDIARTVADRLILASLSKMYYAYQRWNGGKGIPFLWAHKMDDLKAFIGTAEAEEDEKGLHFVATFDDTEEAQKVRQLYKDGRLRKFSFAYEVKDEGTVVLEDGTKANELRELELFEISAVTVPANEDAAVVDVKSAEPEAKSGARNSKKDADRISQAIALLKEVLGEIEEPEDDEDETEETDDAKEDPKANEDATSKELDDLNARKDALLSIINKMEG
jgi:HK97 family phage prohead protease